MVYEGVISFNKLRFSISNTKAHYWTTLRDVVVFAVVFGIEGSLMFQMGLINYSAL
jgi:hypothetical protein